MSNRLCHDWIECYLDYVENSEPADMFKLWTAISCVAACMKRKCRLELGLLTFYPNLYVVLVGPSGCRKGTAMGPGFEMLSEIGIRMAAEATTREALIRALRISSDTTVDQLSGKMELHASLTIFSQELSVFLGFNNMQLMSDLTDWYDCRTRWNYDTKNKELADYIVNVWVNLFGATTPSLIQSALPTDAIGLGLTSRIIFVYEQRKGKTCVAPIPTERQLALRPRLLHDLELIHMMSGRFSFTQEAFEIYGTWYLAQESKPPFTDEKLAGYVERRPNHLLKLSLIMSASRGEDYTITAEDIKRALSILLLTEKKMPLVFGGVGRNPAASVMNRIMALLAERGTVQYEEIIVRFSSDADIVTLSRILETLQASKLAEVRVDGTRRLIVATEKIHTAFNL